MLRSTVGIIQRTLRLSCGHRGRNEKALLDSAIIGVAVLLSAAWAGMSASAAQETTDVAYVEAVTGRVLASSQGKPALLDVLDTINDRTRLDLQANSELSICHYRVGKVVSLKGPLRALVSTAGVTSEAGKAVDVSAETCAAPVVSTVQGGIMSRSMNDFPPTTVPLRPSIKVVARGNQTIRKMALLDDTHNTVVAKFDRNVVRPELAQGKSYFLVVEMSNGRQLEMMLQANAATQTRPVILVVR